MLLVRILGNSQRLNFTAKMRFSQGAPRVMLQTAVQNTVAQRVFAREGFRSTMLEMAMEL